MSNKPSVAVIIVNYNSNEWLKQCLDGLTKQTYQATTTIVVDNNSDVTPHFLTTDYPHVRFIQLDHNTGFAKANNIAAQNASDCEWLALLNPDAIAHPTWLENLMHATHDNSGFQFFGSQMLVADNPEILDGTGDIYHVSGRAWRRGFGEKRQKISADSEEVFAPCAAAALYKRSVFLQANGFDESFFCYYEDIDLAFRLRLLGYRCLYVPEAIVHHVGSAVTQRHSDFYIYHGHRNLVWTYWKNMPRLLFWLYLPQHIALNILSILWFGLQGRWRIIVKAKFDAIKALPNILKQRKKIQKSKKIDSAAIYALMARGLPFKRQRKNA